MIHFFPIWLDWTTGLALLVWIALLVYVGHVVADMRRNRRDRRAADALRKARRQGARQARGLPADPKDIIDLADVAWAVDHPKRVRRLAGESDGDDAH